MVATPSLKEVYDKLPEPIRSQMLDRIKYLWAVNARPEQLVPETSGIHALFGGRGAGKTRAGAEWIREKARNPNLNLLIVGRSALEVRRTLVEGESGVLNVTPTVERPLYRPGRNVLEWSNGTRALCVPVLEDSRLRGVQAHYTWADEATAWPEEISMKIFGDLRLCTRLGVYPQILITATPTHDPLTDFVKKSIRSGKWDVTAAHASTWDNYDALSPVYVSKIAGMYKGTPREFTEIYGLFPND